MAALRADPHGLLVDSQTADDLQIERGDRVQVILARGTKQETLRTFTVVGLFDRFPGFPQGTNLVANLHQYTAATGSGRTDFFLARTTDGSSPGLARATAAIRAGPGKIDPLKIDSTRTALDKDQSSITALNVNGLVNLNAAYALALSAAVLAIFVFGLILQRRREYATLLAQGLQAGELRALVLGETAFVAVCGLVAGALVGIGVAYLMVYVLRPLFILDPAVTYPAGRLAALAGLTALATLGSALAASALLGRIRATELLRET
jgi:putative ABC transport system permease protein